MPVTCSTYTYIPTAGTKKVRVLVIGSGGCAATTSSNAAAVAGGSGGDYAEATLNIRLLWRIGSRRCWRCSRICRREQWRQWRRLLIRCVAIRNRRWRRSSIASSNATIFCGFRTCWHWYWRVDQRSGFWRIPVGHHHFSDNYQSGLGGGSSFGGGASQRRFGDQGAGRQGVGPGAGGSGAAAGGSKTTGVLAGGAGAPSIVIVEEYF